MADIANQDEPLVQAPPAATVAPSTYNPILQGDTVEGRAFRAHQEGKKRTLQQSWTDAVNNSVGAKIVRNLQQRVDTDQPIQNIVGDSILAITGQAGRWGESKWDKASNFEALTKDLPREYWEDVMEQDTLEGAQITRNNINAELARLQRMGLDRGAAAVVSLAGGLVDIDAPLVLASGGMVGAAKVSGRAAYLASRAGLRGTTALRFGGAVAGASGGAQAGALIGVGDALNSDVSTWTDAVIITLTGAALGTTIGGVATESMVPLNELRKNTLERIRTGDPYFFDETGPFLSDEVPASRVTDVRDAPMVMETTPALDGEVAAPGEAFDIPEWNPNAKAQDLSAAFAGPSPSPFPALKDPVMGMSDRTKQIISASRNYIWSTDFDVKVKAGLESMWGRVSTNPIFQIGTGDVTRLWRSKSSVLNRLAAAVFEVPSGIVRGEVSNAAILKHNYEKRIMRHTNTVMNLMNEWAKDHGHAWIKVPGTDKVVGTRKAGQQEFYRQVMLDMNAVAMGRARNADPRVRAAADAYGAATSESLDIMRGRPNEIPLAGAENVAAKSHFMPYKANGAKMAKLLQDGLIDKPTLYEAYKNSYLSAGTFTDPALASQVAKAYVDRFVARGTQIDDSMLGLFSQDGREFLENALRQNGKLTEQEIAGFMKKFDSDAAERGKISTLKNRNDLDLETPLGNTGLVIADMMQNDLDGVITQYARQVAGNSALARHGITSRSARKEWIDAALAEQRALGEEPIDPQILDAMFSEFDGGPQIGYDRIAGQNRGIGVVAEAKSLTSLALLTFNGFAQLAETGVGIVSVGAKNWYNRGVGKLIDKAMRDRNKDVLNELAHYMGAIGQDHNTLRMHLNLDEAAEYSVGSETTRAFLNRSREVINQANYIQGYTSLVNTVRQFQQETAVLGMLDKISRMIKAGDMQPFELGGRIQRDTGLDVDHFYRLKQLIDDGTIVFRTDQTVLGDMTYVDRLNLHLWPEDLAQDFASALGRSEAQIVQQALAGETSRWMHTQWGATITHLQTFPLLAIQKQFFRNGMSRDGQLVALSLAAYGTAYMAISLRDALTGTERDPMERAKTAFGYSNITGWMPMYSDPVMSMLGMEDLRVNSFGPYARPFSAPIIDTMNNLYRAPGAAMSAIRGEDTWTDRQAVRSVPFFRLVESAVRVGSFGNVELLTNPRANEAARAATQQASKPKTDAEKAAEEARKQLFGN